MGKFGNKIDFIIGFASCFSFWSIGAFVGEIKISLEHWTMEGRKTVLNNSLKEKTFFIFEMMEVKMHNSLTK